MDIRTRIKWAWRILRGRPVAYKLDARPGFGLTVNAKGALIRDCTFYGPMHSGPAISVANDDGPHNDPFPFD